MSTLPERASSKVFRDCLKTPVPRFHHSPSPCEGVAEERSDADGVVSSVASTEIVSDDAAPRQASPATPLCSKEGNGWREHTDFSNSLSDNNIVFTIFSR